MADGKFIETGRRFINTWDCDENAHLNIQAYFALFEEAEVHYWIEAGLSRASSMHPVTRHVRFHKELFVGDMPVVTSALTTAPNGRPALLSLMHSGDALVATCLSVLAGSASPRLEQEAGTVALSDMAVPRSVPVEPAEGAARPALQEAGFVPTYRAVVQPSDCDGEGQMSARHTIARASDAAGHIWDHIGLTGAWLEENNHGRVAVEMKLTPRIPSRSGDALLVLSGLTGFTAKTISMRHDIVHLKSGDSHATVEATAVCINKATRRAIAWPEDKLKALEARVVRGF